MSSSASPKSNPTKSKAPSQSGPKEAKDRPRETNRDLIEQIVVAFILALLIQKFEAEAFVIPTGSMAPTLMGRHKDVTCPECGVQFQVNASEEVEDRAYPTRVAAGTCLNCRAPIGRLEAAPSFKGDRILVMKFLYDLPFLPGAKGPERFDITVFKYPESPETNYIKRLVGLPNEELQIHFGDLRVRPLGRKEEPFRFPRRPLTHQSAMQMLVWDDAHRPTHLSEKEEWQRWKAPEPGSWSEERQSGWFGTRYAYRSRDAGSDWKELRYRHLVPDPIQWQAILNGASPPGLPRATLITDFYSYNSGVSASRGRDDGFDWYLPHWVGDLTLTCQVRPAAAQGRFRLELVKAGVPYRCEFDLATGQVTLFQGATPLGAPAASGLKDTSTHEVTFSNVDGRLTVWVDGATPFGDGLVYDDGSQAPSAPTEADLNPVGVASQGAAVEVSDLVLKRDIYYTLQPGPWDYASLDLHRSNDREVRTPAERVAWVFDVLADPSRFPELARMRPHEFPIRPGHYMMLGDNSPRSKDSRGWGQGDRYGYYDPVLGAQVDGWATEDRESWEVPQSLLVGKAFFVYWPHGVPIWPRLYIPSLDIYLPFRPYFERMKWIR